MTDWQEPKMSVTKSVSGETYIVEVLAGFHDVRSSLVFIHLHPSLPKELPGKVHTWNVVRIASTSGTQNCYQLNCNSLNIKQIKWHLDVLNCSDSAPLLQLLFITF